MDVGSYLCIVVFQLFNARCGPYLDRCLQRWALYIRIRYRRLIVSCLCIPGRCDYSATTRPPPCSPALLELGRNLLHPMCISVCLLACPAAWPSTMHDRWDPAHHCRRGVSLWSPDRQHAFSGALAPLVNISRLCRPDRDGRPYPPRGDVVSGAPPWACHGRRGRGKLYRRSHRLLDAPSAPPRQLASRPEPSVRPVPRAGPLLLRLLSLFP